MYSVSDDSPTLLWFSVCYKCPRKKFQTRRLPPRRVMKGFRELGPVQGARTSCLPRPLALSDGVSVFFVLSKSCSEWHEEAFDMFKCKVWWGFPTTFKVTLTREWKHVYKLGLWPLISENNIKVLDLIIWRSYSTPSNTGKSQFMIITTVGMTFFRFWRLERFSESRGPAHMFENLFQLHFEQFRIANWRIFGTGFPPIYIDFWWEPAIRPVLPVSPHRKPSF